MEIGGPIMRSSSLTNVLARIAVVFVAPILITSNIFAQQVALSLGGQNTAQASFQEKLQQVTSDKANFVANIVSKWEADARASGKWDANYTTDMQAALMKLQPANLVAVGDAISYSAVQRIIRNGASIPNAALVLNPNGDSAATSPVTAAGLGDFADNLVYTPINPCRIVDTRNAGGKISGGASRSFDVDNTTSFAFQGGNNGPCGIPFDVASAVEMTITSTNAAAVGFFTAWAVGSPQPLASVLNYTPGVSIAGTVIVPVLPGSGNDFNIFSSATSDLVVDVLGYFAAPVATPLNCTQVNSGNVAVAVNTWTAIDAFCPTGFSATGGGWSTPEGSLGYPGVWLFTLPNGGSAWRTWVDNQTNGSRQIASWAQCCQVPGR
jgi:hypothetical protein